MADTIRTKAELISLLADNSTEDISPQNLRDMLVSYHIFGELGFVNNSTAMSTLPAGWNVVPLDQAGPSQGVTLDTTNNLIQVNVDGNYRVGYAFSWTGPKNQLFDFGVLKNGSIVSRTRRQDGITVLTEIRNLSGSGTLDLLSTDEIQLGVQSPGNDFTLKFGGLRIERLE